MLKNKYPRGVSTVLAWLCFFTCVGVVGAVEHDNISIALGAVLGFGSLGGFYIFARLGGCFYNQSREAAHRRSGRIDTYNSDNQRRAS